MNGKIRKNDGMIRMPTNEEILRELHQEVNNCHNEIDEYRRRISILEINLERASMQYEELLKEYDRLQDECYKMKMMYDEVRGKSNK